VEIVKVVPIDEKLVLLEQPNMIITLEKAIVLLQMELNGLFDLFFVEKILGRKSQIEDGVLCCLHNVLRVVDIVTLVKEV